MKKTTIIFLLLFLCSYSFFAQPVDSAEKAETPQEEKGIGATFSPWMDEGDIERPMDGITLFMGVYSPFDDEMKGIYGSAFSLSGQYCLNMSRSIDLLTSIGFVTKGGDPYYDIPTFSTSSDESSSLRIIPLEISMRYRMALMKNPYGSLSRGLYAGAGINYIWAKEEIPGTPSASGGDFGAQIFAGPQIFINRNLAFEGEVKLLLNSVDMKYEEKRYSLTLSGLLIRAGLSWYY
jgi:hypothetical protein